MKISKQGIELIKKYEGCRLSAYRCPAGVWTIGYGHTLGVRSGQTITQKQADDFLTQDLEKYEHNVMAYDNKYHWTQSQFDALVSFAFNIGNITGLTGAGTRDKYMIADKMLLYINANGKPLTGLRKRREEERTLFLSEPKQMKSNEDIAREVIDGLWGNGRERTKLLKEAGYDPKAVQKIVNQMIKQNN